MDNAAWVALAGGVVTSVVNSWLAGLSQVAEELREARGKAYPAAWAKTRLVSRWPRAETTSYARLGTFHDELRGCVSHVREDGRARRRLCRARVA